MWLGLVQIVFQIDLLLFTLVGFVDHSLHLWCFASGYHGVEKAFMMRFWVTGLFAFENVQLCS